MSGEQHIIQRHLCEITDMVVLGHLQYFCFRSLNVLHGERCACCITVSVMEMTMWLCPTLLLCMPILSQLNLSLWLCSGSGCAHSVLWPRRGKLLLDACTLMSEFYFSQCCVLWVIFSFTMMILEINFKLDINGMAIELHILYLCTY